MTARWLLVLVGIVAMARRAEADCMSPRGGLSPPPGTALPADPTLYLFTPTGGDRDEGLAIRVRDAATGDPIASEVRVVATAPAMVVRELRVAARDRVIEVVASSERPPARYSIGSAEALTDRRVAIVDVRHERDYWTCSHTDAAVLAGRGNAAAYRLEWGDGVAYLPPSSGLFFGAEPIADVDLKIGHVSCLGDTVVPGAFALPQHVRLTALFSDGTRLHVGAGTLQLSTERMLPWPLLGVAVGDSPPPARAVAPARETVALGPLITFLPALVAPLLVALGAAGGVWLTRRRRRRALARHPIWPITQRTPRRQPR